MTGEKNWSHHPLCSNPWAGGEGTTHARRNRRPKDSAARVTAGAGCTRGSRAHTPRPATSQHKHPTTRAPLSIPPSPTPCVHTCTHSTHAQAHAHVHTAAAPPHAESNRAVPGRQRHSVAHRRTAGPDASGTFKEGSTRSGPGFLHRRKHRGRGQHLKPSVVPRNPPGIPHKASSASATSSN